MTAGTYLVRPLNMFDAIIRKWRSRLVDVHVVKLVRVVFIHWAIFLLMGNKAASMRMQCIILCAVPTIVKRTKKTT